MRNEFAMRFAREGPIYRPGADLHATRHYMQHPNSNPSGRNESDFRWNPDFFRERWWDDGTILAGGREYTALLATSCFKQGELSCLSCHSIHRSEPVNQLKAGADQSAACTQCHKEPKYTTDLTAHTFHKARSAGSNCHMPHTSYALFRAVRSHQISSPAVQASVRFGTPNALGLGCSPQRRTARLQPDRIRIVGHGQVLSDRCFADGWLGA